MAAIILALLWLSALGNRATEALTLALGLVLLISPMLAGAAWQAAGMWAAYLLGVALVMAAGGVLVKNWSQARLPRYQHTQTSEMMSARGFDYRRVSSPL